MSFKDNKTSRDVWVHYIKVNKANKKGAAAAFGGTLYLHDGHPTGDFHIDLVTKVNDKPRTLNVETGDFVFRTGESNRWQVLSTAGFNKRFSVKQLV